MGEGRYQRRKDRWVAETALMGNAAGMHKGGDLAEVIIAEKAGTNVVEATSRE